MNKPKRAYRQLMIAWLAISLFFAVLILYLFL